MQGLCLLLFKLIVANDLVWSGQECPEHLEYAKQADNGEQIDNRLSGLEIRHSVKQGGGIGYHYFHVKTPPIMRNTQNRVKYVEGAVWNPAEAGPDASVHGHPRRAVILLEGGWYCRGNHRTEHSGGRTIGGMS